MQKFKKWSWLIITILSFVNIVYISVFEGFVEGKVWPFFVTLVLGLYFCYRSFIKK